MALPVIVKSSKRGMQLVLDSTIPYEELLDKIQEKFLSSKEFFQNSKLAIHFLGRELSYDEEYQIIQLLSEICNIEVTCILKDHDLLDYYIEKKLQQLDTERNNKCCQFHHGDIRAGQTLEVSHSVVILGNVLPGGKVLSKGNIVILGSLKGTVFAGISGKSNAFICARRINTKYIRIADAAYEKQKYMFRMSKSLPSTSWQIAYAKDKTIVIEPLTSVEI